ncbi:MAG: YihY/virulence factor BrkB family protein [Solirubrobacteraceae bacterium]
MLSSRGMAPTGPPADVLAVPPSDDPAAETHPPELVQLLLDGFKQHDLLTYASAISFQILTAIIPFLLFILAVAGLLHLDGVWRDHLEPQIRASVSSEVFAVIDNGVAGIFASRGVLWATVGGGLALWQVSGAVRAVMGALARIYGAGGERPFVKRYLISFALSIEVGACLIAAALCVLLAPFVSVGHGFPWTALGFLLRWTLVVAFLGLAVGLLVRHAPSAPQTMPWVTLGATIVIVCWIAVSLLFYVYLSALASYQSVFGNLAAVVVAMAYPYISTTVFLFGAQLDAIIRAHATGTLSGDAPEQ